MKSIDTVDSVINELGFGWFQVGVIFLCGLVQASDMMEIQYVSMVSQKLQCVWWISDYWKSFITSGTFLGLFFGAYLWAPLGDKHCRRTVTAICMAYIVLYGGLTALAPNVVWVLILRLLVGAGIGGVQPLCATVLSEFMPARNRGLAWFLFQSLWCVGGLVEIGLAWLLMDLANGWRYLAAVTAVPMLLMMLPWLLWLPVSPRQSLLQGRMKETRQALDRIADTNLRPKYTGEFDVSDLLGKHKRGSIPELLRPDTYLRRTLQLALIFFTGGFSYYGLVLLNVQIPILMSSRCLANYSTASIAADWAKGLDRTCHSCSAFSYLELLVPTIADLVTALVCGLLLERFLGRRVIMAVSFCLSAVLIPLLSFCMASPARIALFFIIRSCIFCGYNVVGLYVMEAYPTTLRATAAGFQSSFSRIGSILAPFVVQIFVVRVSLLGGLLIFSVLLAAAALSAALLPLETKGVPLEQTELLGPEDKESRALHSAGGGSGAAGSDSAVGYGALASAGKND